MGLENNGNVSRGGDSTGGSPESEGSARVEELTALIQHLSGLQTAGAVADAVYVVRDVSVMPNGSTEGPDVIARGCAITKEVIEELKQVLREELDRSQGVQPKAA